MLLVLDDLQWADELSLSLLDYLIAIVAERSWVVVGLYRTEEVTDSLALLLAREEIESRELGRLTREEIGVMMAEMLGMDSPPPMLFDFAASRSEGNPFFVAEYLQLAVAQGVLRRDRAGDWLVTGGARTGQTMEAAGLPASIRALVDSRMARIDAGVWQWGEAAAVVGRETDPDLLPQVLDSVPEVGLSYALAELQRQGILEETPGGRVRFVHDKFRQAAYDRLSPEARQALHRRAARVLATRDAWREDLGWHWQQAGDVDEAVAAWIDGAEAAARAYAYELARARITSALDLMASSDPRARRAWLLLVDSVLLVQGDHERALEVLRELIEVSPDDGDLGCRLGRVLLRTGHIEQAQEALNAARIAFRKVGDQHGEAETLHHLADCRRQRGQWDEALSYFVHTLELARWLEDLNAQARTMRAMASLHRRRAENDRALNLLEDALDIHRELGNTRGEAHVMLDRARVFLAMGRYADARPLSRAALRMLRRVGDRPAEAATLAEIARLQRCLGNLDKAEVLFHEALRIHDDVGDRLEAAYVTCSLGSIARDRGAHSEAERLYDNATSLAADTGGRSMLSNVQQERAELCRRRGELDRARALLGEAMEAHHASGDVVRQALGLMLEARLHASAGDYDKADAAWVGALERARVSGNREREVSALLGRAEVACLARDAARAMEWLDEAQLIVRHDQIDSQVPALYALRGFALGLGAEDGGAESAEIAVRRAARSGDRYGEARALFWWATQIHAALSTDEQRRMLDRSASLFEGTGFLMDAQRARLAMADL